MVTGRNAEVAALTPQTQTPPALSPAAFLFPRGCGRKNVIQFTHKVHTTASPEGGNGVKADDQASWRSLNRKPTARRAPQSSRR